MNGKTVIYSYKEYYSEKEGKKKKWTTDNHNINESQNDCAKWKKEDIESYIFNDSI